MAYSFQTYTVGQVLTAANMNQEEVNIRDHIHGIAGVTSTIDAHAPDSSAAYDIGTSTFQYRTVYAQNFPNLGYAGATQDVEEFMVAAVPPTWTQNVVAGGLVTYSTGSRGAVQLTGGVGGDASRIQRIWRAGIADWASIQMDGTVQFPSGLSIGDTIDYIGLAAPAAGEPADGAFWTSSANNALFPTTKNAGAITMGNCVGVSTLTVVLGITASSGQAKFFINNSLWQTITTNITSAAMASMFSYVEKTANPTQPLRVYTSTWAVNST